MNGTLNKISTRDYIKSSFKAKILLGLRHGKLLISSEYTSLIELKYDTEFRCYYALKIPPITNTEH